MSPTRVIVAMLAITDGIRFLLIIAKIATLFSPFRVFLPVSAFFFLSGMGYYLYTFVTEHRFTNMSVLLFTAAVIIFMLGLVSEQIALLRMEQRSFFSPPSNDRDSE